MPVEILPEGSILWHQTNNKPGILFLGEDPFWQAKTGSSDPFDSILIRGGNGFIERSINGGWTWTSVLPSNNPPSTIELDPIPFTLTPAHLEYTGYDGCTLRSGEHHIVARYEISDIAESGNKGWVGWILRTVDDFATYTWEELAIYEDQAYVAQTATATSEFRADHMPKTFCKLTDDLFFCMTYDQVAIGPEEWYFWGNAVVRSGNTFTLGGDVKSWHASGWTGGPADPDPYYPNHINPHAIDCIPYGTGTVWTIGIGDTATDLNFRQFSVSPISVTQLGAFDHARSGSAWLTRIIHCELEGGNYAIAYRDYAGVQGIIHFNPATGAAGSTYTFSAGYLHDIIAISGTDVLILYSVAGSPDVIYAVVFNVATSTLNAAVEVHTPLTYDNIAWGRGYKNSTGIVKAMWYEWTSDADFGEIWTASIEYSGVLITDVTDFDGEYFVENLSPYYQNLVRVNSQYGLMIGQDDPTITVADAYFRVLQILPHNGRPFVSKTKTAPINDVYELTFRQDAFQLSSDEFKFVVCFQQSGGNGPAMAVVTLVEPAPFAVYGHSPISIAQDKGDGNMIWVSTYNLDDEVTPADGRLMHVKYQISGGSLLTPVYETWDSSILTSEFEARTYIVFMYCQPTDTDGVYVYGNYGGNHVGHYTNGGSWTSVESGWGANYCGSLIALSGGTLYAIRCVHGGASSFYDGTIAGLTLRASSILLGNVNHRNMDRASDGTVVIGGDALAKIVVAASTPFSVWTNLTTNHRVDKDITSLVVIG